jgi:hypothetical protein
VQALLRLIVEQQERIEELEAEVKRLKELKGKPDNRGSGGLRRLADCPD